jgi:competence protein ComEA
MLSRVFTNREQLLLLGTAVAILAGSATLYFLRERPASAVATREVEIPQPPRRTDPEPSSPQPLSALVPSTTVKTEENRERREITVSVSGAVVKPGVYAFHEHDRVNDAIKAADGVTSTADLSDINQAAELIDGSVLRVPYAGMEGVEDGKKLVLRSGQSAAALNPAQYTISGWREGAGAGGATATPGPGKSATKSGPLELNTATAEELERLPGVGPKLADAIVQYRNQQRFQTVDDLNNVPGIGDKRLADIRPHVTVSP